MQLVASTLETIRRIGSKERTARLMSKRRSREATSVAEMQRVVLREGADNAVPALAHNLLTKYARGREARPTWHE